MKKLLFALVSVLLFAACAADKEFVSPEKDYAKAKRLIDEGAYNQAAMFLEKFPANYPYSNYTIQAEILRAYASYKGGEYPLAEILCEEFIDRHPRHPDIAYIKYLLGMTHFKEIARIENDQKQTTAAIESFEKLIDEHPGTQYAKEVQGRLQKLYNRLAEHELFIGKFYFDQSRYVAAANRFQGILKKYQTTPAIEEALYYLAASYSALKLEDDAKQIATLLQHNYPSSEWSEKAAELH